MNRSIFKWTSCVAVLLVLFTIFSFPYKSASNVFEIAATSFYTGFVNLRGELKSSTFVDFDFSFSEEAQSVESIFGVRESRLAFFNHTDTESWVVNVAPCGNQSEWTDGENTFRYDGNKDEGKLVIDPITRSVIFSDVDCFNTNFSKGNVSAFSDEDVQSIDLIASSGIGFTYCRWYGERLYMQQHIPAGQPEGEYTLGLVMTIQ